MRRVRIARPRRAPQPDPAGEDRRAGDAVLGRLTAEQAALHAKLVSTISAAVPFVYQVERASASVERTYKVIASVLVELRHQFVTADGETPDLRGRSRGYRSVVRHAYGEAGVPIDGPVEKRLSAGVSYWVRKILIDRYGEEYLREVGILPHSASATLQRLVVDGRIEDATECMETVTGILNMLASDATFTPAEELVRSAARAIALMQARLQRASQRQQHVRAVADR